MPTKLPRISNKVLRPVKSVLTPIAQSPALCQLRNDSDSELFIFLSSFNNNIYISVLQLAVIELLFLYGLRISEILNILPNHISPSGALTIKGSKGSKTRVVYSVYFQSFWTNLATGCLPISQTYDRFYFYRLFKKLGIYGNFGKTSKNSVTHYFRHRIIKQMQSDGNSNEEISNFIGHKSPKSLNYYV